MESYLYVNECVTVRQRSESIAQESVLLGLETCESSTEGGLTQVRRVVVYNIESS